jgi:uncharacterized peroxidase-related enzyme
MTAGFGRKGSDMMAIVTPLEQAQAAESIRPVYDQVTRQVGHMLNMFKTLAYNPEMLQGFLALNAALSKVELDAKYRELAYLKTSQLNRCPYCTHYHQQAASKVGLSAEQVAGVADYVNSPVYDEHEKAVLEYAAAVTSDVRADPELIGRLKEFLSDRALVELTVTVALANFTNRVNEALAIDLP